MLRTVADCRAVLQRAGAADEPGWLYLFNDGRVAWRTLAQDDQGIPKRALHLTAMEVALAPADADGCFGLAGGQELAFDGREEMKAFLAACRGVTQDTAWIESTPEHTARDKWAAGDIGQKSTPDIPRTTPSAGSSVIEVGEANWLLNSGIRKVSWGSAILIVGLAVAVGQTYGTSDTIVFWAGGAILGIWLVVSGARRWRVARRLGADQVLWFRAILPLALIAVPAVLILAFDYTQHVQNQRIVATSTNANDSANNSGEPSYVERGMGSCWSSEGVKDGDVMVEAVPCNSGRVDWYAFDVSATPEGCPDATNRTVDHDSGQYVLCLIAI